MTHTNKRVCPTHQQPALHSTHLAVGVTQARHKQARAKLVHYIHHQGGVVAQQACQRGGGGGLEVFALGGAVDLD
eukprot:1155283-Pelagomonas_calceolata.AAC.4